MTGFVTVYVACANAAEAEKIARAAIDERLAACANILPPMQSIYRWQGQVEQAQEVAIIFKTVADKMPALEILVKSMHSYDCPCIVAWPIVAGNAPYLQWITESL